MSKKPKILSAVSKTPLGVGEKYYVIEDFFDQCKQCRNIQAHISFPKYDEDKYIFTCEKFLTEKIPCIYYMPEKIFQSE